MYFWANLLTKRHEDGSNYPFLGGHFQICVASSTSESSKFHWYLTEHLKTILSNVLYTKIENKVLVALEKEGFINRVTASLVNLVNTLLSTGGTICSLPSVRNLIRCNSSSPLGVASTNFSSGFLTFNSLFSNFKQLGLFEFSLKKNELLWTLSELFSFILLAAKLYLLHDKTFSSWRYANRTNLHTDYIS